MAEKTGDHNEALYVAHLTEENVILEQVGVMEDLYGIHFELDDEEWEWDYQEDE